MNFKAVLALPKTARSAQTHKSISFIWIVWSTLYVYLWSGHKHLLRFQNWDSHHISISLLTYFSAFDKGFQIWFLKPRYVFNSQFQTQPDISFSRFPNFKAEMAILWLSLIGPLWWLHLLPAVKNLFYLKLGNNME